MVCPRFVIVKASEFAVTVPAVINVQTIEHLEARLHLSVRLTQIIAEVLQDLDADDRIPVMIVGPRMLDRVYGPFHDPCGDLILLLPAHAVPELFSCEEDTCQIACNLCDRLIREEFSVVVGNISVKPVG